MRLSDAVADLRRRVAQRARLVPGTAASASSWTVAGEQVTPVNAPAVAFQGDVAFQMPTPTAVIQGPYTSTFQEQSNVTEYTVLQTAETNDSRWTWTAPVDGWLYVSAACSWGYLTGGPTIVQYLGFTDLDAYTLGTDYVVSGWHYGQERYSDTLSYDIMTYRTVSIWLRAGVAVSPAWFYYFPSTPNPIPRAKWVNYNGVWAPGPRPVALSPSDGETIP